MPRRIGESIRSQCKEFEMSQRSVSEMQSFSSQNGTDAVSDAGKSGKISDKGRRVNRTSVLLVTISLVVSIAFLIIALVCISQLQGEWRKETEKLKKEIDELKKSNFDGLHDSKVALQTMSIINMKGSKAANASIQTLKKKYINYDTEISELKAQFRDVEDLLNFSKVLYADIQSLKKISSNYSAALMKESEQRENGEKMHATEISALKEQIRDIADLFNFSKVLAAEIQSVKKTASKYNEALKKESKERENADNMRASLLKSELYRHEQEHLNQSRILEERIIEAQEKESNQSQSMLNRINRIQSTYLIFSGKVTEDILEIRKDNKNHSFSLEFETRERKRENANISLALANEVYKLHGVYDELMEHIHMLRQADINHTSSLTYAEETLKMLTQQNYAALSDQILESKKSYELELSGIGDRLEELRQTDSNQTLKWRNDLEELESAELNRSISFASRLQELQDSVTKGSNSLTNEIAERQRMDLSHERRLHNGIDQLKSNQSVILTKLTNMQTQVEPQEAQIAALQSMQSKLIKVTDITLIPTGWKGDFQTLLYKKFDETVTYQTAISRCQSAGAGGRLAAKVFRDLNTVRDMINTNYLATTSLWIGFDDIQQEGIWHWSDGGSTNSATTRWGEGEPNNAGNEDCAEARASSGRIRINDAPCSINRGYICEIVLN